MGPAPNYIFFQAFSQSVITNKFLGESIKLDLNQLDYGVNEEEVALWDKNRADTLAGKTKSRIGTIFLRIILHRPEQPKSDTSSSSESSASSSSSSEAPEVVIKPEKPAKPLFEKRGILPLIMDKPKTPVKKQQ